MHPDPHFLFGFKLCYVSRYLNKRPMGHIAHLRKQFNSINTYDYHNVNWEKKKPNHENWMVLHLNKLEFPSSKIQMHSAIFGWNWPSGSGADDFSISALYFRYLANYSPWTRSVPIIYLNRLEFSSPKHALCQVWLKLAQWFRRRRFFNFVNVFYAIS